jgi:RNA polymerase sigma-70 factor (ECF subfamily)
MPGVDPGLAAETVAAPERPELEKWALVADEDFLAAVDRLRPEKLREAYRLHATGLRYREIARRMEVPEGTVGSWLTGARSQLRHLLGEPGLAPRREQVAP